MSRDHTPWHSFHLARRRAFATDKESVIAAEVSGDSLAKLMGQKLAHLALSYQHCQPLNTSHIQLGWYDRLKSDEITVAVRDLRLLDKMARYPDYLTHNHQGTRTARSHGYVIPS
jgi:hypothetical protein